MTRTKFKDRYNDIAFNHEMYENETERSKYIWK